MYVPLETLQRFLNPGETPSVNRVMVDLKPSVDLDEFSKRWTEKLAAVDKHLTIKLGRDVRKTLDANLQGVHLMSYLGGSVSMLAAAFIVFSALSMGVTERSRTLAMLRAIGSTRGQVARLVVSEGIILSIVGAIIGTPLGWLWLVILRMKYTQVQMVELSIGWGGVAFAAGGSILAAILASLLPAWWATRVRPLEAMSPSAMPVNNRRAVLIGLIGLVLIGVDPVVLYAPIERWIGHGDEGPLRSVTDFRLIAHLRSGCRRSCSDFSSSAPTFVLVLERVFGRSWRRFWDFGSRCSVSNFPAVYGGRQAHARR